MKKEYMIIYSEHYDELEERVATAMKQGYKPHGSLVFRTPDPIPPLDERAGMMEPSRAAFIQPMVLKN